jgi:hypothetical protein
MVTKIYVFQSITLCSPLKFEQLFGGTFLPATSVSRSKQDSACCLLHAVFLLGLFFDFEDQVICSSKMSVDFRWTTQYYIPEVVHAQYIITGILHVSKFDSQH